jgi:hypothetical protein
MLPTDARRSCHDPPGLRLRSAAAIADPLCSDRQPLRHLPHANYGMLHLMQLRAFKLR